MGLFNCSCANGCVDDHGQDWADKYVVFTTTLKDGKTIKLSGTYSGYGYVVAQEKDFYAMEYKSHWKKFWDTPDTEFVCDTIYCPDCSDAITTPLLMLGVDVDLHSIRTVGNVLNPVSEPKPAPKLESKQKPMKKDELLALVAELEAEKKEWKTKSDKFDLMKLEWKKAVAEAQALKQVVREISKLAGRAY